MDLILYNGKIYSMESELSVYQAVAIEDNLIKDVGTDYDILKYKTENTILVDLKGKYAFPGFNDSHMHLMGYGASLSQVDLSGATSIEDVIKITKEFIEANHIPNSNWVLGRGWNQDKFEVKNIPTLTDLDEISDNHNIFLRRACGHIACSNSKVLDTLGLKKELTYVNGGQYENGIFKENAMDLVVSKIPEPTVEDMKTWIKTGAAKLNTLGITSVQSDDLCVLPDTLSKDIFTAFHELSNDNELSVRVYEQSLFRNENNLKEFIEDGYVQNKGDDFFKNGPLKILGDGSLGGRTAWLKETYADDSSTSGISMYTEEELTSYISYAQKNDISSAVHCIGDQMLECALNSIEKAQTSFPRTNLRHGIVHCQITSKEQLERMKRLDVMAYVQPIFLDYDIHIVKERVGSELANTSYSWKTMMDLDLRMSFGSDAPVETPDPIKGIHCAVFRKDLNNKPDSAYLPSQSISVYDALCNYTLESAYASFEENSKGKLLAGYLADLVVLDGNIFDDILNTTIHMTVLDGKIVYKK